MVETTQSDIEPTRPTGSSTTASAPDAETQSDQQKDQGADSDLAGHDEYPPQLHAGKVGLGPQYDAGGGIGDKITGLKEQLKGKITKNPELVHKGQERKTGELAKKERDSDESDPFAKPEEKHDA